MPISTETQLHLGMGDSMDNREAMAQQNRMSRGYAHKCGNIANISSYGAMDIMPLSSQRPAWTNVLYNNPLVWWCGSQPFPQSSTYGWNRATIVDSARNAEGSMIGAVIRSDVAKIELTWKYLLREEIQFLGNLPFIDYYKFYYPPSGGFVYRQMYTSDFNGGTPFVGGQPNGSLDVDGLPPGHNDVRIALIEV